MSKRNIYLIVGFTLLVLAVMVAGNVIVVGQKIGSIPGCSWLEYVFYLILLLGFLVIFILPVVRIHMAPAIPAMSVDEGESLQELQTFAQALGKNFSYIPDGRIREACAASFRKRVATYGSDFHLLKEIVENELAIRFEGDEELGVVGVDARIRDWAKSVFLVTAVSQNSSLDALGSVYMNYKMIENIVLSTGFRPNRAQMFKLYRNVAVTAVVSYAMSEALEGAESFAPFDFGDSSDATEAADVVDEPDFAPEDSLGGDEDGFSIFRTLRRFKIPGIVVGSAIDGASNALMTLRVGYITRAYLTEGASAFSGLARKRRIKRAAMRSAIKILPGVVKEGMIALGGKAAAAAGALFRK